MAISNPRRLANEKFLKEKCDRITADIPKGKRAAYHAIAKELGISLAQLIQRGVEEYAKTYADKDVAAMKYVAPEQSGEVVTTEQRRLLDDFNQLPADSQKHIHGLIRAINRAQVESD